MEMVLLQGLYILRKVGFEEAGEWVLESNTVRYLLSQNVGEEQVLYAFVSEGRVLYVGKTVRSLPQRLKGYMKPGRTQRTNERIHQKIERLLRKGKEVRIFVFAPAEDEIVYRGVRVNLAAGLEDELIAMLQPEWNEQGKA